MAQTLNYRMNLVIDPKNVIKANRELRAMERYFERIQGRVMRIGRTRMAPEIVLRDRASKGLDRILGKINRVKSQIIDASGTVKLKVEQEKVAVKGKASERRKDVKTPPIPVISVDFSSIIQALELNTNSIYVLSQSLSGLSLGGVKEEKPKSAWDTIKSSFSSLKSFGSGLKNAGDIPKKFKALKKVIDLPVPPVVGTTKWERFKDATVKYSGKTLQVGKASGGLLETIGSAGEGIMGGGQGLLNNIQGVIKKGMTSGSQISSAISSITTGVGGSDLGSIAGKVLKGGSKKLLGPLGYAADVVSIIKSKPGKEQTQAIGSAVGGAIGSVLGGTVGTLIPIPVVGTAIGSALGGTVGDFVGGKVGGMIADYGPRIKESFSSMTGWFSKTFTDKKDKSKDDISKKPAIMTDPDKPSKPQAFIGPPTVTRPLSPNAAIYTDPSPRLQAAAFPGPVAPGVKAASQIVQISSEQMTALSGFLRDFKTETTNQFNLPPGAVQVTVHEEYPVDVEGLIQQIGQRLRSEFQKATQNQKPPTRAYI
ncbi:hypothetical protein GRF59_13200 [Paenibacillus sp. HJL G12]|uniref:Tail tape measure protein n=1 Tax=Paenibacillus dendrobii TaxID=2691084 RepID=A0A7X3LHV2_9BACL|nr:hypothetical protein [Paenibacillus dendrobii]MWV44585.1 hypothetical protein [Paenibacillus dendrobii]